jgi:uncharacterized phage protein (TIGR01671 family)
MREIKFRAWDMKNKVMVYQGISGLGQFFDHTIHPNNEYEVMQFTGLLDKADKEIYEGDILAYESQHPKHDKKVFNNAVEFASGQSLCGWRMRNGKAIVKATPYKFRMSEIIGNIYQNPELLK